MLSAGIDVRTAIVLFGLFVSGIMVLVMLRHRRNQSRGDLLHLIGAESHATGPAGATPARALTQRSGSATGYRVGPVARCSARGPRADNAGRAAR
jgi:hypothetical protein